MEDNGVAVILLQYKDGQTKAYNALTSHLADPKLQNKALVQCLLGLKDCVSLLGSDTEHLVGVVMKIDWILRPPDVISAYQDFIINLISARTMYLRACLKMVVRQFVPRLARSADGTQIDDETRRKHNMSFQQLHVLLQRIVKIVPITNTVLMGVLADHFPYVSKEAYIQACYVENLLSLVVYMPQLRSKILELIVDKIMKLDVRSPRDVIKESTEESDEEEDMDIFDMENDEVKKDTEEPPKDAAGAEPRAMTLKEADSLDAAMGCMFKFMQRTCYNDGKLDWEATKKLYRELLNVFDKIMLPTHASSHVQYIMFYICSFKDVLADGFLDYLWKKVTNPSTQPIFRQAAVAYIASFIARAKYIPLATVKAIMAVMLDWTHKYITKTADSSTSADVSHHGPFYSVCQAIFYIFVFKHKQLMDTPEGRRHCQSMNLGTIVTCRLNPLRVCLPVVARTFSMITRHHQLCYCDSIMEKNRRQTLPEASSGHDGTPLTHLNPLDSFFPFDPYLLVRSERYIKPMFQEYEGPVEVDGENSDEEEQYEESEDMAQFDFEGGQSLTEKGRVMATSPTDMFIYGISPGFKNIQ